jgi:small subunit ribosomal protein S20
LARHKSAKKRARQDQRRRLRNRQVKSRVRKAVKEARSAVAGGVDPTAIRQSLAEAERELRRAASKGVIPKKRASRSVARLARSASRAS